MNQQIDANLNNVNCLVTKSHFGYDTIHNLCTGTITELAWSVGDWGRFIVLSTASVLLVGLVAALLCFLFSLVRY